MIVETILTALERIVEFEENLAELHLALCRVDGDVGKSRHLACKSDAAPLLVRKGFDDCAAACLRDVEIETRLA